MELAEMANCAALRHVLHTIQSAYKNVLKARKEALGAGLGNEALYALSWALEDLYASYVVLKTVAEKLCREPLDAMLL
ncbi:MAG: hypothetical protein QXI07_08950 [Pyrobaculum sp.]